MNYLLIKRILDIIFSITGIIILFPLMVIVVFAIRLDSKGPILFKQKRVGIHKTYYNLLKFRSMKIDAPNEMPSHLLEEPDLYITPIGKVLRKTSLDELPQLINILKGEMSLIGPRPALWNQYDLIEERDKYGANGVLPGLTGWAQINGRDELSIEKKAKLDGDYVQRMSLIFDLKCFLKTIVSITMCSGIIEGRISNKNHTSLNEEVSSVEQKR